MVATYICVPEHALSQFMFSFIDVINLREGKEQKDRKEHIMRDFPSLNTVRVVNN
jgi:hypothetical protein